MPRLLWRRTPSASTARSTRRAAWLREPLLHFALIGGLLFAADHLVSSRAGDPRVIVVGREVDDEARRLFRSSRGHDPGPEELAALRRVWVDNEVLYREGLALQVDRGDSAIRERVIFKALSVVDANTKLPPLDDARLRRWFEANRARYDEPPRFDFQEAVLTGDASEAAARRLVATLNSSGSSDPDAGLRVFKGRPMANLVQSYGAAFATALETAPLGEWRAQPTRDGWRAIRLEALVAPRPASFDSLRGVVLHDWTDATLAEQRSAAVRLMAEKYTIRVGDPVR